MREKLGPGAIIAAVAFSVGSLALVTFAAVWPQRFAALTLTRPFLMGFGKLFLLGTFGEVLKVRLSRGHWGCDHVLERALVWGVYGCWFTLVFPGFSILVDGLVEMRYWPAALPLLPAWLWIAFSKSLWLNFLGMYAWGMMLSHDYCNHLIRHRWRSWRLEEFARKAQPVFALAFLPKTLLFWIPAQTFTYALPGEWRVFMAALLAVVLGFLLSVGGATSRPAQDAPAADSGSRAPRYESGASGARSDC